MCACGLWTPGRLLGNRSEDIADMLGRLFKEHCRGLPRKQSALTRSGVRTLFTSKSNRYIHYRQSDAESEAEVQGGGGAAVVLLESTFPFPILHKTQQMFEKLSKI